MANKNRDEFLERTKLQIAKRAGWHCSDLLCRRLTTSSNSTGDGEINLGTAAHICAAAPGGPRYDPNQTREQRRSADNGIWMCKLHGTAVDAKDSKYTVELLLGWKVQAQKDAMEAVLYDTGPLTLAQRAPTEDELRTRVHAAIVADLDVFRRSEKWPSTTIALTLEVDGLKDPINTSALAAELTTLDDLILVAPPGMGKTTTLFQIAEAMLANNDALPIVVSLGDWSVDNTSLLESIVNRPAFREVPEDDLRTIATKPGVILLLDGWNELDAATRKRAEIQISRLQTELPELGMLISTRKQALNVPMDGIHINLKPLSEKQQLEIAKTIRGDVGLRLLDQAWRTAGVRELVTIPLYLTALLALPEGTPFPSTKEEVLRCFVAVHEEDTMHTEVLMNVMYGLHERFIVDLAATATRAMNTTLAENVARRSVTETDDVLVSEGQITEKPQPNAVLETLVSHHVLMRVGDPAGYSFQHQQFQEWYASHFVERLMLKSISDDASREMLKANILNQPTWEEAILFASERLARGDYKQQEACGAAILAAFEVDPIFAAEMISRSNDTVWANVAFTIQGLVKQWHIPGKVDRALRFMISSGRPEFCNLVWPLITHENDQIHLSALRAGRRFRPSVLGSDAAKRIAELPANIRKNVLHQIASNSGMDGLDLATAITKNDPNPEVKATVIDALAFRRADRHVSEMLRDADEKTFDLVVRKNLVDHVTDEHVKKEIEAAFERQRKGDASAYDRLRAIIYARDNKDHSNEVTAIISEMEIEKKRDAEVHLLYKARNRYSHAVADGVLQRVRVGRTLFYGADDVLASANFILEEDDLLEIVLSETGRLDDRAEAAASVLGPQAVGCMIEDVFHAKKQIRDESGKYNQAAADHYHGLLVRIAHTPGRSLIAAVQARSARAKNEEIADLAELISVHPDAESANHGRPFDDDSLVNIRALAEDWGNRMLDSDASRSHLASIATLVTRAPSVSLLPLLKRLLDENLRRYRAFKEEAKATGWRPGEATNEARTPHTLEYQRAFQVINVSETTKLMCEYLHNEHFGECAAKVLAVHWIAENEPEESNPLRLGVDFSCVYERRAKRAIDPIETSIEAEAIFSAVESLLTDDATEEQKKQAVSLGIVAARLPHGQRDATIQKLITLAPRWSRDGLLQNLILSGENIDIEIVKKGIAEVFEAAKTQHWILSDGYVLKGWLRLLPFASPSTEVINVVLDLPEDQRRSDRLEEMISCFQTAPGDDAENVLFRLAEADPILYTNHDWRNAAIRRGTISAARRFVDLAANGAFEDKGTDRWYVAHQLSGLIVEHPELRSHVYQLLNDGATTPGLAMLAQAIAENPDVDGLLLLIRIEIEHNRSFISWQTTENVVTEHIPSENWKGVNDIVPVPAVDLRRELLAMATDGGPTDAAARCLNQIDEIRDEYGTQDSEPRHPDLASGKPWPIMVPDQDMKKI